MKTAIQLPLSLWITLAGVLLFATLTRTANAPTSVLADDLGGAERYLAYLSIDKPVYRQGENVYLCTVILHAADNTPLQTGRNTVQVKISGPDRSLVASDRHSLPCWH